MSGPFHADSGRLETTSLRCGGVREGFPAHRMRTMVVSSLRNSAGTVLEVATGVGLVVATNGCPLLIKQAQLEGKAPTAGTTLLQQLKAKPGSRPFARCKSRGPIALIRG